MPTESAAATIAAPESAPDPFAQLETVRAELTKTRELLDQFRRDREPPCLRPVPRSVSDETHRPEDRPAPRPTSMTTTPNPDPASALTTAARAAASTGDRSSLLTYLRLKRLAAD